MNKSKSLIVLLALIVGASSCTMPVNGSGGSSVDAPDSAVALKDFDSAGTDLDGLEGMEYGTGTNVGVYLYFNDSSTVVYSIVDGFLPGSFPTDFASGTEATSGGKISVGSKEAVVGLYWENSDDQDDPTKAKKFAWVVEANEGTLAAYSLVTSMTDPTETIEYFRVKVIQYPNYTKKLSIRPPTGATVQYVLSDELTATPSTALPAGGLVDVNSQDYALFSYVAPGDDPTDPTVVQYGYVQIGTSLPAPTARVGGTDIGYGSNVTLSVGSVINCTASSTQFDRLYYYVSTSSISTSGGPNVNTASSGYSETVSSGSVTLDVTYTTGTVYLYLWGRSKSDANSFSQFFFFQITQGSGTVTPPPVTPPASSSFSFGVSFTPSGTRPIYVFKLQSMDYKSGRSADIYNGSNPGSNISLSSGWYAIGAGSSTVGWLSGGAFTMTIGTVTSPNTTQFHEDYLNSLQWFVTVKNDGSLAQGLVPLN